MVDEVLGGWYVGWRVAWWVGLWLECRVVGGGGEAEKGEMDKGKRA